MRWRFWEKKETKQGTAGFSSHEMIESERIRAQEERARSIEEISKRNKEREEQELEVARQIDLEARKVLQGNYLERYILAKSINLDLQAEIARIEGMTATVFMDMEEQEWLLRKKMSCHLGYSVGGQHYSYPRLKSQCSSVKDFPGKISHIAMVRYQNLISTEIFEEIRIFYFDIGVDPLMYGVRTWKNVKQYFLIETW